MKNAVAAIVPNCACRETGKIGIIKFLKNPKKLTTKKNITATKVKTLDVATKLKFIDSHADIFTAESNPNDIR